MWNTFPRKQCLSLLFRWGGVEKCLKCRNEHSSWFACRVFYTFFSWSFVHFTLFSTSFLSRKWSVSFFKVDLLQTSVPLWEQVAHWQLSVVLQLPAFTCGNLVEMGQNGSFHCWQTSWTVSISANFNSVFTSPHAFFLLCHVCMEYPLCKIHLQTMLWGFAAGELDKNVLNK